MDTKLLLIAGLAVLAILATFGYRRYKDKSARARNREISLALKRIAKEAGQRGVQAKPPGAGDPNEAMLALKALAPYPEKAAGDIKKIESLWAQMSSQISEFTQQPPRSTLQSSLLTTRTMKMAEEIRVLAENAQRKLNQ